MVFGNSLSVIFISVIFAIKCDGTATMGYCKPEAFDFIIKNVADPEKIIHSFGYPAETHKLITEDGYVLVLHRIPKGILGAMKKSPVLIMHGLSSSSADFINLGPNISLGYILADKGYDVWMGNARGNSYSNNHIYINPNLQPDKFYNFSWHEIGTIDLPTKIDYILKLTKTPKLHYIGHSQGGTVFYVMTATKPEYNKKIRLASLMGPAGFVTNVPDPLVNFLSHYVNFVQFVLDAFNVYHIPLLDLIRSFLQNLCQCDTYFAICNKLFYIFGVGDNNDDTQLNKSVSSTIFRTTPSDASIKQFIHYFQEVKSGKFQRFDYGPEKNLQMYGASSPLEYNLSAISTPVALYYGKNDRFIGLQDVHHIAAKLPHLVKKYLIPYKKFNHGDFLFGRNVKAFLYNKLLKLMEFY